MSDRQAPLARSAQRGPRASQGVPGQGVSSLSSLAFTFAAPATIWTATHNLNTTAIEVNLYDLNGVSEKEGDVTFRNLNFSDASNARVLQFQAGLTHIFTGSFNVQGTSGKNMTVQSISFAVHTLAKASGTVSCDYISVFQSTAGGGAGWYAGANSSNLGTTTGWIFTAPPASSWLPVHASASLTFF